MSKNYVGLKENYECRIQYKIAAHAYEFAGAMPVHPCFIFFLPIGAEVMKTVTT